MTRLKVRNMVCDRCIMSLELLLQSINLKPIEVGLGYIVLESEPGSNEILALKIGLHQLGFELIEDPNSALAEQVRNVVIHTIYKEPHLLEKLSFSTIIEEKTGKEYKSLSSVFSQINGYTIEQFIIAQRIERVKELLSYDELNISEIADELRYSSVAHLSNQFRKVTGQTPSEFRKNSSRGPIDKLM